MDFNSLLTSITDLILDPEFQDIGRKNVITSSLECIKCNETDICNILAWILDPKEGHLQGDYFVKSIINAIYQAADMQLLPSKASVLMRSFSNIQVMTEVSINEIENNKSRRIDLLLADYSSKTIFIIERKDGSIAHSNQLYRYQEWADKHYKSWDKFYVLSDSYERNHGNELPEQYVTLDDSWLKFAIKNILEKEALPTRLEQTFKEIYDFILDEWDENSDPCFKGRQEKVNKVANTHSEIIEALHNHSIIVNNKKINYIEITPSVFYSQLLPFADSLNISPEQMKIFSLIQSNFAGLDIIEEYGEFELILETLKREYRGLTAENNKEHINFSLKKHEVQQEYWPYYLSIYRKEIDGIKNYNVDICVNKNTTTRATHIAEKLLQQYEIKVKTNWKFKRENLLSQLSTIDLTHGSILRNTIDDFIQIANTLPSLKSSVEN